MLARQYSMEWRLAWFIFLKTICKIGILGKGNKAAKPPIITSDLPRGTKRKGGGEGEAGKRAVVDCSVKQACMCVCVLERRRRKEDWLFHLCRQNVDLFHGAAGCAEENSKSDLLAGGSTLHLN